MPEQPTSPLDEMPELARTFDLVEMWLDLPHPWSEQFSEDEQVRMWEYVDQGVNVRGMLRRGVDEDWIVFALHPYRLPLTVCGRPEKQAQQEYIRRMVAAVEKAQLARVIGRSVADSKTGSDVDPAPERRSCVHTDGGGLCEACADFVGRIEPILTRDGRKPKQEDVATALGYTTRHLRRLCEGLGYRSWSDFYADVRSGRLSSMS